MTVFDKRSDAKERLEMDAVFTFFGFKPDLAPIRTWGIELANPDTRVHPGHSPSLAVFKD